MSSLELKKYSLELWTSLVAQTVKRLPIMRETRVRSLGQEDPLEKKTATHSSTLAWKIPWMEEHGRLQSMDSQRVGHDWVTSLSLTFFEFISGLNDPSLPWIPHYPLSHLGERGQWGADLFSASLAGSLEVGMVLDSLGWFSQLLLCLCHPQTPTLGLFLVLKKLVWVSWWGLKVKFSLSFKLAQGSSEQEIHSLQTVENIFKNYFYSGSQTHYQLPLKCTNCIGYILWLELKKIRN